MAVNHVLLVCIGVLGDLAWRKFIAAARALEAMNPNVELLLLDIAWRESERLSQQQELGWRIGRRCIELMAEEINKGQVEGLRLKFGLDSRPLPWEIDDFCENYLEGSPAVVGAQRDKLHRFVDDWVRYFSTTSLVTGLPRYSSNLDEVGSIIKRLRDNNWRVALFVATPPQAYPKIINQWKYLADRIVLEKPACGLEPSTLTYANSQALLEACRSAPASTQIVTSDHYNAKALVRLMDRISDYHLLDTPLSPRRIKRIVVQLLEADPLPLGRNVFYVGAGGAFGDMVPHLFQAARAVLGLKSSDLKIEFTDNFCWGRYDTAPLPGSFTTPTGIPYNYDPDYYQPLTAETETFVTFEAQVRVDGYPPIPFFCRTGKGLQFERKSLRVDTQYDEQGSEMSLLFNFADGSLTIRDDRKGFALAFAKMSLRDPFASGVPSEAWEYPGIFDTLVNSEWQPDTLDERYFPSVRVSAELSSVIYERLLEERSNSRTIHSYSINRPTSRRDILSYLDSKAHWG
jgi:glucose-6-phosphate 1-dehydrogenase